MSVLQKNKEKRYTQYEINYESFEKLFREKPGLADKARTVVMWYLKNDFGKDNDKRSQAIEEAANWCGFKVSITKRKTSGSTKKWVKKFPYDVDEKFYRSLYHKFKRALNKVEVDENDKMGLLDETLQVANIMLKYKYIITLKRNKRGKTKSFWSKVCNKLGMN